MPTPAIDTVPTQAPGGTRSTLRDLGFCLLAAGVYFCVAKLSLFLAFEQANTSAVWPCSGLAIGGPLEPDPGLGAGENRRAAENAEVSPRRAVMRRGSLRGLGGLRASAVQSSMGKNPERTSGRWH